MSKCNIDCKHITLNCVIILLFLLISFIGNQAVYVFCGNSNIVNTVVIDAGHGGVDGGAISCTGIRESEINLEIAQTLEDLMHLLGIRTVMTRDTDRSIHTEGESIAAKKVSDIRNRVKIVNETPNQLLVSIHQNKYTDSRYSGAQVFYNQFASSEKLAAALQEGFRTAIDPSNHRQIKKASGVYLMEYIQCTGVLIECGFLSNPAEELKLQDKSYQLNLCTVIATTICQYLNT